jgi:hypothetical protein
MIRLQTGKQTFGTRETASAVSLARSIAGSEMRACITNASSQDLNASILGYMPLPFSNNHLIKQHNVGAFIADIYCTFTSISGNRHPP